MKFNNSLLAAVFLVGACGMARAQSGPTFDPTQLPEIKGKVGQFLLTTRGDVEGMLLADDTEVHTAPRLSSQIAFLVKPGEAVTIHGLRAKAIPMVLADSVTNDATGATITGGWRDAGGQDAALSQYETKSQVKAQLHTARGDIDGVVLNDGTIVRLSPLEAQRLSTWIVPGQMLYVRGPGISSPLGKVLAAQALGPDKEHADAVAQHPLARIIHGDG